MWVGEITLVGKHSSAETTIEHASAAHIAAQPKYRPSIGEAANRGVFFFLLFICLLSFWLEPDKQQICNPELFRWILLIVFYFILSRLVPTLGR